MYRTAFFLKCRDRMGIFLKGKLILFRIFIFHSKENAFHRNADLNCFIYLKVTGRIYLPAIAPIIIIQKKHSPPPHPSLVAIELMKLIKSISSMKIHESGELFDFRPTTFVEGVAVRRERKRLVVLRTKLSFALTVVVPLFQKTNFFKAEEESLTNVKWKKN